MFEKRVEPLISRGKFILRFLRHFLAALGIVLVSLAAGAVGYHSIEGLPWIDALLNAAMILTGMGPVSELHTASGKLFATLYALYSGLVFVIVAGILGAPLLHRLLHRFHLEASDGTDQSI